MLLKALAYLALALLAAAEDEIRFNEDPYLEYRPDFARSLPVQILLNGVILTLVAVLFIHLIFTAQYHWPLAPVNYVLQMSGVATLLISLIATLHVVLAATMEESQKWPYMLSYIAVNVPPVEDDQSGGWSVAERATWLIMNATTSGLIQITHIQFLTLLYPSKLEGRLVFSLLGPLAILAAILQLVPIHGSPSLDAVASAIRNVCNATLSLLFTVSLFVWGLLVNREQAWRTDGGTAAFGCAALVLAVASTALNFLYIPREEEYVWLPSLMWAVVLWQSFLGWWWWVGAGSGTGQHGYDESEGLSRREAHKAKRKRPRKASTSGVKRHTGRRDVTGALPRDDADSTLRRRSRSRSHEPSSRSRSRSCPPEVLSSPSAVDREPASETSTTTLPRVLPAVIHRWYAMLRQAHLTAARKQSIERAQRIQRLERSGRPASTHTGWGLGSFAWKVHRPHPSCSRRHRSSRSWSSGEDPEAIAIPDPTRRHDEDEEVQVANDAYDPRHQETRHSTGSTSERPAKDPNARESFWWWGPLRRWRLQDSTIY